MLVDKNLLYGLGYSEQAASIVLMSAKRNEAVCDYRIQTSRNVNGHIYSKAFFDLDKLIVAQRKKLETVRPNNRKIVKALLDKLLKLRKRIDETT